eukprot:5899970-Pyramimonas_sp.AAC.1
MARLRSTLKKIARVTSLERTRQCIRHAVWGSFIHVPANLGPFLPVGPFSHCLLYTSDAADDTPC